MDLSITSASGATYRVPTGEEHSIFKCIPDEVKRLIFDCFSPEDLARAQRVCRSWRALAGYLWNVPYPAPKTAFTIENYMKHWEGKGVTFENKQPFTRSLYKYYKERNNNTVPLLTQIPTINGEKLTLRRIIELFLTPKEGTPVTLCMWDKILEVYGDTPTEPGWVQLTFTVIEGTRSKQKGPQIKDVEEHAKKTNKEYRLPKVIEAVICIGTRIVSTGKCEGYARKTATRCEEEITDKNGIRMLHVGDASPGVLDVDSLNFGVDDIGAAGALRTVPL